jgi:hypothetical protein
MVSDEANRNSGTEPTILIIGCDFHAGFQVLSIFDNRSEEGTEKKLSHAQEAIAFYKGLKEPARGDTS